jgi:2'-5' RNA ligase
MHVPRPEADELRDHWGCWPEWTHERPRLLWYLTFEDQPEVAEPYASTRAMLAGATSLDVVPTRWLHLTLADVCFVDQIDVTGVDRVADRVAEAVCAEPPLRLALGPLTTLADAVVLAAGPPEPLHRLREQLREATGDAVPDAPPLAQPVADPFWPHLTLSYLTGATEPHKVREVVETAPPVTSEVLADRVTLAEVTRSDGHYYWSPRARVPLGG